MAPFIYRPTDLSTLVSLFAIFADKKRRCNCLIPAPARLMVSRRWMIHACSSVLMLFTRVCESRDDIQLIKFCPVTFIRRVANSQHMYYQLDCTLQEVGLTVWNLAFFPIFL